MLLHAQENLEDFIVKALAIKPALSADALQKLVHQAAGKRFSIQGIYQKLRKLQRGGVVVKAKQSYSLRLPWILDVISFSDSLSLTYFKNQGDLSLLPHTGKKVSWKFTNLLRLNDFWSQILLLLFKHSKTKKLLGSHAHPWYHFAQPKQEEQYIKSVGLIGGALYLIIYGDTYLDKWAEPYWKKHVVYSFGKNPLKLPVNRYVNLMDDYVLTITFDHATTSKIETLYKNTTSEQDVRVEDVLEVFHGKVNARFQIEHNAKRAGVLRKKFERFFGEKFGYNE